MRQNASLEVEEMEKVLINDVRTQQIVHSKYVMMMVQYLKFDASH